MKTLILALVIVTVAVLLLGVNALFRRGKSFPAGHSHELGHIPERQRRLRAEIEARRLRAKEADLDKEKK